jgi:hypothetical protein
MKKYNFSQTQMRPRYYDKSLEIKSTKVKPKITTFFNDSKANRSRLLQKCTCKSCLEGFLKTNKYVKMKTMQR